jgi:integrase
VDDGKIKRNPCRIKGASDYRAAERSTATVAQSTHSLTVCPIGFRVLVLAAAFTGLCWGELIALRRCDVDLIGGVMHVRRRLAQPGRGALSVNLG